MNASKIVLFAGAAVVVAGGLLLVMKMNTPPSTSDARGAIGIKPGTQSTERELNPFTNVASIPATVDPSTIRFEKLKVVQLASKTQVTTDPQNCKEIQFRDPGSSNCESVRVLERVKAVEATYSFIGPQTATGEGEIGPSRQFFSVYFHPEDLPVNQPVQKLNREQAGSMFQISTARPTVQQRVIDKQNSHFCAGNYVDGSWTPSDPKCQDQVQYTTVTVPSTYWAVDVSVRHPMVASR
jgi:hypothetical protein